MNTANRSFALVMATAAAPYGMLLLGGCGLGAYVVGRVAADGFDTLGRGLLLAATAMLVLLFIGAATGAISVTRQVAATRRVIDHVDRNRAAPPLGTPLGVEVVDHDEPFAFTFGFGEPRVAVSRGLVERLSAEEIEAVVVHERYHVHARDPLKLVAARAAARTCFFLPAVSHLVARYLAGRELAADRRSLRDLDRSAVAGALFKVVAGPGWDELDTAAAMARPEMLAVRVDQLERGTEPTLPALPGFAVAISALVLATLGGIVIALMLESGLPGAAGADHSLSIVDLSGAVAGGLACTAGWVLLVIVAWRRSSGGVGLTPTSLQWFTTPT